MKRFSNFLFLAIICLFFSCTELLSIKESSLVINLPGGRFVTETDNLEITEYIVGVQSESGKNQTKKGKPGESLTFDSLSVGKYLVYAQAYDKEKNCVAYAQQKTEIKLKETTFVQLNLTWNLINSETVRNGEVEFIITPPKKTVYTIGDYPDYTGLKVEAKLKNGYTIEIPLLSDDTQQTINPPIHYEASIGNDTIFANLSGITIEVKLLGEQIPLYTGKIPITVNLPSPTIITQPQDVIVSTENGQSRTTLSFEIETIDYSTNDPGYLKEYQWYRKGYIKQLEDTSSNSNTTPDKGSPTYTDTNKPTLTINFAQDDDNTYEYYCVVKYVGKPDTQVAGKETSVKTRTVKVTAVPQPVYTVSFIKEDNDDSPTILSAIAGSSITVPNAPTKSGYKFTGWATKNAETGELDGESIKKPGEKLTVLNDTDYYAVWEIEATSSNPLTNWADLVCAIESSDLSTIYISGDMVATEYLMPERDIEIIAASPVTIFRNTEYIDNIFFPIATFTLKGTKNAPIILDGNTSDGTEVNAAASFIQSEGTSVTLEYVTMKNCHNSGGGDSGTDGGAIYMTHNDDVTTPFSLTLRNCTFSNNKVSPSIMSGGAVAIDGTKISSVIENCTFNNNSAESNQYGGAIYIYGTTVEGSDIKHVLKNCTFTDNYAMSDASSGYGGALYLCRGTYELDGLTMSKNYYKNSTENQQNFSDIYAYNAPYLHITLKNTNNIDAFNIDFGSEDTPEIKLDNSFSKNTKIKFICTPRSGSSVESGDTLITVPDGETLDNSIINCFEVMDTEWKSWTLGEDGKLKESSI
ncbi:MAG: hypothetical protein E7063_02635 [Spirochaetaceae bacterium]|nr:hypothetical protein [Spirochaetaceae bacterium]